MKIMVRYLLCFLLFVTSIGGFAQDHHFTQYFASPQILSPANTGFLPGKYRAVLLHRDQWRGILEKPYTSTTANFDIKLPSPIGVASKDYIGIGLAFMNDHIGVIDLNNNVISMGLAYHKFLARNSKQYLRAGFQISFSQTNINYQNLFFSDQFNGVDAYNLGTLENLPSNIFAYTNFNLGLMYTGDWSDRFSTIIGGAIHNVFEPNASFYEDDPNVAADALRYRRISTHVALKIGLTDRFSLIPRANYAFQGPYSRLNAGMNYRLRLSSYSNNAVQLGTWLRMAAAENSLSNSSLIALVAFEIKGFNLGFSYDIDMNSTSGSELGHNAFEVSFGYIGQYEDDFVFCPQF